MAEDHQFDCPVGTWKSYLGGGHDLRIGMKLTFREDGTGEMDEWGFDHFYLDPEYESVPGFTWRTVQDKCIEIEHKGEKRVVDYEIKRTRNEYGIPEFRIFQPSLEPDEQGEKGFWYSPYSLVYQEDVAYKLLRLIRNDLTGPNR